jgi:hypothetical protein
MIDRAPGLAWTAVLFVFLSAPGYGHHVLGRPAYSLNEDSNTPPSLAVETQIGSFFATYMVFPAFPKPQQPGRVNLYATHIRDGQAYNGEVSFYVRDDRWFGAREEFLGSQLIDDGVYRQGFIFSEPGAYIIRAHWEAEGEPYDIDFPLQIGAVSPIGTLGWAVGSLLFILLGSNLLRSRRLTRAKIQSAVKQSSPP